eukprot:TRINITY_DN4562_c0_g2_i1.p1 TRINITY_DN4562_c0_g2~~TRINITY_DN4562_c0_g2_i1.p1  ORF type:complete len:148 (+),score=8.91 TRINITY_DN4562_c0_g2_i1:55-498(+)
MGKRIQNCCECLREGVLMVVVVAELMMLTGVVVSWAVGGGGTEMVNIGAIVGVALCLLSFGAMWNRKKSVTCQIIGLVGLWALTIPAGHSTALLVNCSKQTDSCKPDAVKAISAGLASLCHVLYIYLLQKKPRAKKNRNKQARGSTA